MTVGHGSVGTPGCAAGVRGGAPPVRAAAVARARRARLEISRSGFPLGAAANYYLGYLGDELLAESPRRSPPSRTPDGTARRRRDRLIPHLADFLERVAAEGSAALFRGDVARAFVADMAEHGGIVTQADLDAFTPVVRPASLVTSGTGRSPRTRRRRSAGRCSPRCSCCSTGTRATSGRTTTSSAGSRSSGPSCGTAPPSSTSPPTGPVPARRCSTACRRGPEVAGRRAVDRPRQRRRRRRLRLLRDGVVRVRRGRQHPRHRRLAEQLPRRARAQPRTGCTRWPRASGWPRTWRRASRGVRTARVLAIGSPGADRITTALAQVIASFAHGGYDLQDAVDRPRVHLSRAPGRVEILHREEDIALPETVSTCRSRRIPPRRCSWVGSRRRCARRTEPWSALPTRAARAPSPSAERQGPRGEHGRRRLVRRLGSGAMSQSIRLAVVPGDGIGPEVVAEGLKVLRAAVDGVATVETTEYDLGARRWHATGETLPDSVLGRDPRSTTRSCSARSATRACRAASSSAGCCCGCASSSTTTSTCARPGCTRA